ncbi:MAG: AmmeMemoRadiSam system protein B [Spirochaetaceae bacterium]
MLRSRTLPPGWYPQREEVVRRQLERWRDPDGHEHRFEAVVVPHAGWDFSGELAFRTMQRLLPDPRVVVVVGGHLREGSPVRMAPEDGYETPLGVIEAAAGLRGFLDRRMEITDDTVPDNTVEVQLPMVKFLFPRAQGAYLRSPPDDQALRLGEELAAYARETDGGVVVIGSTDLTHYGPNFGFTPRGTGEESLRWVREQNDRGFLDAVVAMDARRAIDHALSHHSACSPGAAATAATFAGARGARHGVLVGHATSYEKHQDVSFVGYGGVGFAA